MSIAKPTHSFFACSTVLIATSLVIGHHTVTKSLVAIYSRPLDQLFSLGRANLHNDQGSGSLSTERYPAAQEISTMPDFNWTSHEEVYEIEVDVSLARDVDVETLINLEYGEEKRDWPEQCWKWKGAKSRMLTIIARIQIFQQTLRRS